MKARRSRHRVPVDHLRLTEPVSAEYQREVDQHMARIKRDYAEAQRNVERAEQKARHIQAEHVRKASRNSHAQRLADAWAVVELRRLELEKYERMMTSTGTPNTQQRGRDSFRPVPIAGTR